MRKLLRSPHVKLTRYLRPQLRQTLPLLFVLCANILLQLINPLIMRRFLDSALSGGQRQRAAAARMFIRQAELLERRPGDAQSVGGSRLR